jgi:hypothetical protein
MDEYLSRRIKNWGAWQHPDRNVRKRLLEQAAGGPDSAALAATQATRRLLSRLSMPQDPPEKNPFSNRYSRHTQLAILNLEIIYRSSPLRYA